MGKPIELNLDTIDGGALMELVGAELRKIADNIQDPNIKADAKRKLVITVEVLPNENRSQADLTYGTKTTMPSPKGGKTFAYIAQAEGSDHLTLFQVPPAGGQPPLFEDQGKVKPFSSAKEA